MLRDRRFRIPAITLSEGPSITDGAIKKPTHEVVLQRTNPRGKQA
jgi:hypothetical protein